MDISQKVKGLLPKVNIASVLLAGHGTYNLCQGHYLLATIEYFAAAHLQLMKNREQVEEELVTNCKAASEQIPETIAAINSCINIGTIDNYLNSEYEPV